MNLKWSRSTRKRSSSGIDSPNRKKRARRRKGHCWRGDAKKTRVFILRDYDKAVHDELCGILRVDWVWSTEYRSDNEPYAKPVDTWMYYPYDKTYHRQYQIGEVERYTTEEAKRACEAIYILGRDLRSE